MNRLASLSSAVFRLGVLISLGLVATQARSEIFYFEHAQLTRVEPHQVCFSAQHRGRPGARTQGRIKEPLVCTARAEVAVASRGQQTNHSIEATKLITYQFAQVQEACIDLRWQLSAEQTGSDLLGLTFRCMPKSDANQLQPSALRSIEAINYLKNQMTAEVLEWPQLLPF